MRGRGLKPDPGSPPAGLTYRTPPESPPVRGRGLKLTPWIDGSGLLVTSESPPVRGRGLKQRFGRRRTTGPLESPPVRGRGLKRLVIRPLHRPTGVAPRAGARGLGPAPARGSPPVRGRGLKQAVGPGWSEAAVVAPRAGARIETGFVDDLHRISSPPVRGRGLKPLSLREPGVAPRAGARIETIGRRLETLALLSPPVRGRGLKHGTPSRPPCGGAD